MLSCRGSQATPVCDLNGSTLLVHTSGQRFEHSVAESDQRIMPYNFCWQRLRFQHHSHNYMQHRQHASSESNVHLSITQAASKAVQSLVIFRLPQPDSHALRQ